MSCVLPERKRMKQCIFIIPTQSDILLCGIARFSWANKNKLEHFSLKNEKNLRTASLKQNLQVLIKTKSVGSVKCNRNFNLLQRSAAGL